MGSTKTFRWGPEAMQPETIEVPYPNGATITHKELSRKKLFLFIDDINKTDLKPTYEKRMIELVNPENNVAQVDDAGEVIKVERTVRVEPVVTKVAEEKVKLICKWLAETAQGDFKPKYFEDMDELTGRTFGNLIEMLFELNHVDEILSTSGNLLMLPLIRPTLATISTEGTATAE
jgi:hypothetical protein